MRVVAATNRDLEREVREGRFREDLFYRLNVIPIALPPLRERRTDIPLLVEHFLAKHGEPGRARQIAPEALEALVAYAWPGNVRELESVVERTLLLADGDVIRLEDLPAAVRMRGGPRRGGDPGRDPGRGPRPRGARAQPDPAARSRRRGGQRDARGAPARAQPADAAVPPGEDPGCPRWGSRCPRWGSRDAGVSRSARERRYRPALGCQRLRTIDSPRAARLAPRLQYQGRRAAASAARLETKES